MFFYCSLELRELEAKLKAGYMNKTRAAQIAEKEVAKYEQNQKDAEVAKRLQEEAKQAEEEETKHEEQRYQEMVKYQQVLKLLTRGVEIHMQR